MRKLSLLFLLAGTACAESQADSRVFVPVRSGPLVFHGYFYGELQARSSEKVHAPELTSTQFMTVDTVLADGSKVKQGDVVVTFVKDEIEAELRNKKSELAVSQASMRREREALRRERIELELAVRRAELNVERAKLFVVEGVNFISEVELEKSKIGVERAKLELSEARKKLQSFSAKKTAALQMEGLKVETAREEVQRRENDMAKMEVIAPADGVLFAPYGRMNWVRGKAEPGRVARPGDKLVELPDLSRFNVEVAVRQKDATLIEVGDEALVYPNADPERLLTGKVSSKDSFATTRNERLGTRSVEGNLKEVKVVIELEESPDFLRPGGSARVEIRSQRAGESLRVPLAALREHEEKGWAVELETGELRRIEIGAATAAYAQVVKGLSEGERVALSR